MLACPAAGKLIKNSGYPSRNQIKCRRCRYVYLCTHTHTYIYIYNIKLKCKAKGRKGEANWSWKDQIV
jgi:hypothetical protein